MQVQECYAMILTWLDFCWGWWFWIFRVWM